jgi:hypothetical protein
VTGPAEDDGAVGLPAVGVGARTGDDDASGALVVEEGRGARLGAATGAVGVGARIGADETAGDDVVLEERAHWQVVAIKPASETQVSGAIVPSKPACSISLHTTGV